MVMQFRIYPYLSCSVFFCISGGHAVQMLELVGSPKQLVYQKEGVAYALNCGGPAYEATNGIVYTSEHHQFVNKKGYEYGFGEFLILSKHSIGGQF